MKIKNSAQALTVSACPKKSNKPKLPSVNFSLENRLVLEHPVAQFHNSLENAFGPLNWSPKADGEIHRFHILGDRPGTSNGWYVLNINFRNFAFGAFGSWKSEASWQSWSNYKPENYREASLFQQQIAQIKQQRDSEKLHHNRLTAERAKVMWQRAIKAKSEHPYLTRKGVEPHNLRQLDDILLVPLYSKKNLVNLQQIFPSGAKRFLKGGKVSGCHSILGKLDTSHPLYVAEGWATAATLYEETGCPVACALNAGNLLKAGYELRHQYPEIELIIAADNDRKTEIEGKGNPGIRAAKQAALMLGCSYVAPNFPDNAPIELSDFNDLVAWWRTSV